MERRTNIWLGLLAWVATAVIVTTWQLVTRWGVTTSLTPIDLALFRYGIPGAILALLLWTRGTYAHGQPRWVTALIVFGGGLPFGLLGMIGAQFAPAAHMGALLPGSMPLFVSLAAAVMLGERYDRRKLVGLSLIVIAAFLVTSSSIVTDLGGTTILGDLLFLAAGVSWAVYTVAFRRSGLDAWHGAAIICGWSTLVIVPIWLASTASGLATAPAQDVVIQIAVQGFLAGLFGMFIFGVAVSHLGPTATALSGSVVPAATALGGWLFLDERLGAFSVVGIAVMIVGLIAFATGKTVTSSP